MKQRTRIRALGDLAAAQLRCVGRIGCIMPLAAGALIAGIGSLMAALLGTFWATSVMIMLMPLHALVVGIAAVAVLAGDPLVELTGSTPVGIRSVLTMRAALVALGGATGALVMFAPLHMLGTVYGDAGWASAISPVGGAMVFALAAYAMSAASGSSRSVTFGIVLGWTFLSLFWDTNTMSMLGVQRGVPMALAFAAAAGAWFSLGDPERAHGKAVGTR